jgi:hypothetical protein
LQWTIGRDPLGGKGDPPVKGSDVQEIMQAVLPEDAMLEVLRASGMQRRERKFEALRFLRAAVIAAAQGQGGRQSMILDAYFQMGAAPVVRGASYGWFSAGFENAMAMLATRAMAYARLQPLDLPGWIGRPVTDWHAVDSMTIKLDKALQSEFPGTGDYAALKVHKRFSIGLGTTVDYHISPAREHDAPHLKLDESWRGLGLLVDLGYASRALIRDAETFGVKYVIRLKENWKPKVHSVRSGDLRKTFFAGSDFDAMLDDDALALTGPSIDADVRIGTGAASVCARLVGVQHEGTYRYYLTNLASEHTPEQVATLYRVRWEIEVDNKLDKSNFNIDGIRARSPHAVRALVHASITASILVCLIAHAHRLQQAPPPRRGSDRTTPPIHAPSLARIMTTAADRIAAAMALEGDAATREWEALAKLFVFRAADPNWRSRPSVLDQLRGWVVRPAKSRGGGRKPRVAAN